MDATNFNSVQLKCGVLHIIMHFLIRVHCCWNGIVKCITHNPFFLHTGGPDYAHRATGFPTWHRLFLLWFEREMQHFLQDETFTVHYWDWRNETERTSLFQSNRLGAHDRISSAVTGELVDEWRTICWYGGNAESGDIPDHRDNQNICDPSSDTGLLRRCPDKERCAANYSGWPSYQDVETAVGMEEYDRSPYDRLPCKSFRNYMEGFHPGCDSGTRGVDLCESGYQRLLHNTVSCESCLISYQW